MAKVPCPYCGRLVDRLVEGMCEDCYFERHPLVTLREARVLRCKYCGAVFLRGRWLRPGKGGEKELMAKVLAEKASLSGVVEDLAVREGDGGVELEVTVRGSPHPSIQPRVYTYKLKLELIYDLCISCREMLSRREVALLQIRAAPGELTDDMRKKILSIIEQELFKLKDKKIGFISNIKYIRTGLDIYTTSTNLARHLAYVIHRSFPSHVVETAKAVGVKDGRRIYHMTYLIRIATYKPGDAVKLRGRDMVVVDVDSKYVHLQNRETKEVERIPIEDIFTKEVVYLGHL
ncbi:NMD3-related protein [Pyrobaculum neutrophilum]|uniref:NMD3 family protein n=1 Tax=Pyrobaculum neutrophilum (strain DSM 2338 / JCM 9278 / NBRC 100436 / V24Sta) TaxID=444157 RepID=B1YCX5_PYRNV|nr:NMD3-related protein [Pyrobaculum neutrophilum]ACB39638.1 NMD3 family protein [Pyrobaculum neutrophilum V24Sta]